ncbi:hypothetical protein ADEAN_001029100 [Angomonas deanei]|uniref:Uncharacterized protein n=1 Tax=Angomonas deanei TaxID=59799 RepID=A0A7G2CUW9_9TRYP|nr:hypothetical protein ADEAN_001029100 [Angomonas deanei]
MTTPTSREPISEHLEDTPMNQRENGFSDNQIENDNAIVVNDITPDSNDATEGVLMGEDLTSYDKKVPDLYADSSRSTPRQSGFFYQLGVTIKRALILMFRRPCAIIVELLIPIVFVCGTIIIWAVLGNDEFDDQQYFNPVGFTNSQTLYTTLPTLFCYDSEVSSGIGALADCTSLAIPPDTDAEILCAPEMVGAPPGLCALNLASTLSYRGWRELVLHNSPAVPTLDEMIFIQWANRMMYELSDMGTVWGRSQQSALFSTGTPILLPRHPGGGGAGVVPAVQLSVLPVHLRRHSERRRCGGARVGADQQG